MTGNKTSPQFETQIRISHHYFAMLLDSKWMETYHTDWDVQNGSKVYNGSKRTNGSALTVKEVASSQTISIFFYYKVKIICKRTFIKERNLTSPIWYLRVIPPGLTWVFGNIQKLTRNGQNLKCNLNGPRTRHSPLSSIKGGNSNSKRMGIVSPSSQYGRA